MLAVCTQDLLGALDDKKVGDKVKVEVMRGGAGRRVTLTVTLGERQLGRSE